MDEEEEVDIVGGYDGFMSKNEREISNISSGQILSCDYTVHPQWLNDTAHWPENFPKQSSQDEMEMVQDEVVIEEPAPIDFNNWCDETNSNCGDLILEQDIPATLEEEVITNSGTEEADDSEIYSTTSAGSTDDLRQIISTASSASASVSSSLSTSLPPPALIKPRTISINFSNPRSLLKKNLLSQQYQISAGGGIGIDRPPSKFRKTLLINKSLLKSNQKIVLNPPNEAKPMSISKLPPPIPITGNSTKEFLLKSPILESYRKIIPSQSAIPKKVTTTTMSAPPTNSKQPIYLTPILKDGKHCRNIKPAPKFRQTVKLPKNDNIFQSKTMRKISKNLNERNHIRSSAIRKETSGVVSDTGGDGKITFRSGGKGKRGGKKFVDLHGENITINHDVESGSTLNSRQIIDEQFSPPPPPLARPITMLQNESDDDLEIDIECADTSPQQLLLLPTKQSNETIIHRSPLNKVIKPIPPKITTISTIVKPENSLSTLPLSPLSSKSFVAATISNLKLESILNSNELPTEEYQMKLTEISELEKFFHSEFFEGRTTKTPERYLKIRNYILTTWNQTRPTYVNKTAVRNGLKHCGDVNCISRIHSLLEQIGAINFGCDQCYYIRPLRDLLEWFTQSNRNKSSNNSSMNNSSCQLAGGSASSGDGIGLFLDRRQRVTKSIKQSPNSMDYDFLQSDTSLGIVDANYTVSHVDGTVVTGGRNLQSSRNQRKNYRSTDSDDNDDSDDDENGLDRRKINAITNRNSEFQLIKCLRFNRQNDVDKTPPFLLSIKLSTLLCMHLHSFSSKHEIMGFLGGQTTREPIGQKLKLTLCRYKPCKTSAQSSTMCEMCPVSQVEQANNLIAEGYDLLGWFHSHPTFPANPSRTDVATQSDMQLQFSIGQQDRPFVGLILSLIDMRLRCMYILPEDLRLMNSITTEISNNQQLPPGRRELIVPYEIDISIVKECATLKTEIIDVFKVIDKNCDQYPLTIKQFTSSATNFLQQIGYSPSILATLNNIL